MAGIESEIRGFAIGPSSRQAIAHIWIIDRRQVIMMEQTLWPRTKSLRSVVFVSKQTALDSSAQLFECVPACQREHFATTSQILKKGGDVSTFMIVTKKLAKK